jgi:hypothetical protein
LFSSFVVVLALDPLDSRNIATFLPAAAVERSIKV